MYENFNYCSAFVSNGVLAYFCMAKDKRPHKNDDEEYTPDTSDNEDSLEFYDDDDSDFGEINFDTNED